MTGSSKDERAPAKLDKPGASQHRLHSGAYPVVSFTYKRAHGLIKENVDDCRDPEPEQAAQQVHEMVPKSSFQCDSCGVDILHPARNLERIEQYVKQGRS